MRKQEADRTQTYDNTRRSIFSGLYQERSTDLISHNCIAEECIGFRSSFAPMIIVEQAPDEIRTLAEDTTIVSIDFYEREYDIPDEVERKTKYRKR